MKQRTREMWKEQVIIFSFFLYRLNVVYSFFIKTRDKSITRCWYSFGYVITFKQHFSGSFQASISTAIGTVFSYVLSTNMKT